VGTNPLRKSFMTTREAIEYFRVRGAKDGLVALLRLRAQVCWAAVDREEKEELFLKEEEGSSGSSGSALDVKSAQDLLAVCQAEGQAAQEVQVLDTLTHLHLIRENTNRALKCNREAQGLAKELSDTTALRQVQETLEILHLLRGDSAEASKVRTQLGPEREGGEVSEVGRAWLQEALHGKGHDLRGRLCLADFLAHTAKSQAGRGLKEEVKEKRAQTQDPVVSGMCLLLLGKMSFVAPDAAGNLYEASRLFRAERLVEAEAAALQALATALLVKQQPDPVQALQFAEEAQALFQSTQDLRGQAIGLQLIANCKMVLQDSQRCLSAAYEAIRLFNEAGDDHGRQLVGKMLKSFGQSDQQILAALVKPKEVASFQGLQGTQEKPPEVSEELQAIMAEQVVWEYAWVPCETQDPKYFGEKHSGGVRRVMVASELRDPRLLRQLASCRKSSKAASAPFLGHMINGRLLTASSLQLAMEASLCTAVVYDVIRLNNLTQLEVLDAALRLIQALQPIEEPHKVALDIVLGSTQQLASVKGVRVPFHATLWGLCRTARIENPTHEFRVLDVDASTWLQDLPFISRYLLGAQSTRPCEAILRKGCLQVSRLVSARAQLKAPLKMVRKV